MVDGGWWMVDSRLDLAGVGGTSRSEDDDLPSSLLLLDLNPC